MRCTESHNGCKWLPITFNSIVSRIENFLLYHITPCPTTHAILFICTSPSTQRFQWCFPPSEKCFQKAGEQALLYQGFIARQMSSLTFTKSGAPFKNGKWVKTGNVVTYKDGFVSKSRHNYLPATAMDIVLFRPDGTELKSGPEEKQIKKGATKFGFEWGGDWENFQDMPHIQLPLNTLYKSSLERDSTLQWQKYLYHAGKLDAPEELDGAWGEHSKAALDQVVGTRERTPEAWSELFQKFGAIEDLDFPGFSWIPSVK